MKTFFRPLIFVAFAGCALAQRGPDVYFGVGTSTAPSSNQSIDTFGTGNPFTTPKMAGAFGKAGADIMITPHFGVGGETDFRFTQGAFAGLQYRPMFYDFNVIWLPTAHKFKRVVPEIQGGLGAVSMKFYYPQQSCSPFSGCSTSTSQVDSSNHFQVHMSGGIRFYATNHFFVRPQVDLRYVDNFTQFGRNWVPEYGVSVGWSFGER